MIQPQIERKTVVQTQIPSIAQPTQQEQLDTLIEEYSNAFHDPTRVSH